MLRMIQKKVLFLSLAMTMTACSANIAGLPGVLNQVAPTTGSGEIGPSSGGQSVGSMPIGIPAAPGVGKIDVSGNTFLLNYVGQSMMVADPAGGSPVSVPLPADPALAAEIQSTISQNKSIRINRNKCGVEIISEGKIFTYDTVQIEGNEGCIKISSL